MAHQLTLYATPDDLLALEQRVRGEGPVVFLEARSEQSAPHRLPSIGGGTSGGTWLTVFLVPEELLGSVVFRHVPQQGYWTLDLRRSPAVELSRCFFDGEVLRAGRLFYDEGFYDADGQWVEKPEAFLAWAKRVLAAARKEFKRDAGLKAHVGPDAARRREETGLKFVSL